MKEYYEEYREQLQSVVDKSEDEFEKKLIYIAAGALGLSFTFISDIVDIAPSTILWALLVGWIMLIGCICLNLVSHMSSKNKANKTINDIDTFIIADTNDDADLRNKIDKRNKNTDIMNYTTIGMLIFGIICIVFFVSYNMVGSINSKSIQTTKTEIVYERQN